MNEIALVVLGYVVLAVLVVVLHFDDEEEDVDF
jgi:hypothetical protein